MLRVVVTDTVTDELAPERSVLHDLAEVVAVGANSEDDLVGQVEQADALIVFHNIEVTRNTIERLRKCRLIVRCGVGYDNVDWQVARSRGIDVANVPDYGTEEVADSALALMLSLARGTNLLNNRLRQGAIDWTYEHVMPLCRLRNQVVGVVGLGRIGTATALRAKSLGMDVLYHDPYKPDGYDKAMGIRAAESLTDLLAQSYVVTMHCPLSDDTHHLIDAAAIAKLQPGSLLVNTSRGAVVDTSAVPDAIVSGQLAGAGIDVLADEPPAADDPLIRAWRDPAHPAYERVIVNSHAAFYSEEGLREMRTKASQECRRALLGEALRNVVN